MPDIHYIHQDANITIVYPGITAEYHSFETDRLQLHHDAAPNRMEINHCHYGRVGWDLTNGQSLYMGEGDTTIHSAVLCCDSMMHLPLGSFQGITITVDFDVIKENVPDLLASANIDFNLLQKKFCRTDTSVTFPSGSIIDQILHSLYHLPEHYKDSYLKIKTIELILFLSQQHAPSALTTTYNSDVVSAIREIHRTLTENLEKRYTIPALSSQYLINTTLLKDAFKAVYGMPIATYMKEYRLRHAAKMLRHTDQNIAEIGRLVGYETPSKFTKAFKELFGMLPKDYRKCSG